MRTPRSRVRWNSVLLFCALTFVLGWVVFWGLRPVLAFNVRAELGMFAPLVAALVTRFALDEGFGDFGLRLSLRRSWRWAYPTAYLLPLVLTAIGVALALLTHQQQWVLYQRWEANLNALARQLPPSQGRALHNAGAALLFAQLIQDLVLAVFANCLFTLGEEFGWRGHLLPRLVPLGEVWAALVVGIVWGLWHAPLIGLDGYEYGVPSWLAAPFFCLFTIPLSGILTWLRLRSGSTWPGVLLHATVNQTGPLVITLMLSDDTSRFVGAPVGLLGVAPFWAFAVFLVATGRLRLRRGPSGYEKGVTLTSSARS
ncbi:MAG: CPBP family intramembrane metalloprotease [Candidatus Dormibacteraeota bacterium]|nr:CPBP family intramembrane metalloprotease [Candidatus Dormibacteraeota bacterium]